MVPKPKAGCWSGVLSEETMSFDEGTALSPESTAGSSEAKFNWSPFCVSREWRGS